MNKKPKNNSNLDFNNPELLGLSQERNLEGDDEMSMGPSVPSDPQAKWPFSKSQQSADQDE